VRLVIATRHSTSRLLVAIAGGATTLLMAMTSPAAAAGQQTAYVLNYDSESITPINTNTNAPGTPITIAGGPAAIAITPDGKTAYVANYGLTNSVTPIDTATNTVGTPISVGDKPDAIAITPDGKTAYVVNQISKSVTPITLATNTTGTAIAVGDGPSGIAITPDGKTAYVVNQDSNSVTPINIATNTAGTPITVGTSPSGIAITPDGTTAYVVNASSNSVTPIVTATNTAGAPITVGTSPSGIAISPDGTMAYVANAGADSVTPITIATNAPGTAIPVGTDPYWIAFIPNGKTAYVASFGANSVTPIDTATNTPGTAIPVGSEPLAVAITPDQPPVASFSATGGALGSAESFDASASTDPDGSVAGYSWQFGDGSSATTASAATTHTYATPGTFTVTLTETDDQGCSARPIFTGQTMSCNGGTAAIATRTVVVAAPTPSISSLRETRSRFAAAKGSTPLAGQTAAARSPRGTVFSFTLNGAATVKVAIERVTPGRRQGHRCQRPTRKLRHRPRCTRTATVVTLTRGAHAGSNEIPFTGRISGKALRPGRYAAVFTASSSGGTSAAQRLAFTILPR
jgi:YVTN family beta-propeller protein